MCLFTHFAAGALAGGVTGDPWAAVVAGLASHVVLDVIPHYDHPDWRWELAGGVLSLGVLILTPFATWPAVIGGLAGMLPDLENLFQKLGKLRREQFLFPTHTGLLRHGRELGPRTLVWQAAIFVGCFLLLGLLSPTDTAAATGSHATRMGAPRIEVRSQTAQRTVVQVTFPVVQAPADWRTVVARDVRFAQPPVVDETRTLPDGSHPVLPPRLSLSLAVPTRGRIGASVTDVSWWRDPDTPQAAADLLDVGAPAVFREVPVAGVDLPLAAAGGILAALTLVFDHPVQAPYDAHLATAKKAAAEPGAPRLTVPAGLLNADLFAELAVGGRRAVVARAAVKAAPEFDPFTATSHWVRLELDHTGLFRITGQELTNFGVPAADIDPTKLRLYRGGGLALEPDPEFPDSLQADRTRLNEVAVEVRDGGDGEWNLDDELRFYGVGTSAWLDRFTAEAERLDHYDHPFAAQAVYWLTWEDDVTPTPLPGAPRRVPAVAAPGLNGQLVTTCRLRLHREEQFLDTPGVVTDNWCWDTAIFDSRTVIFDLRPPVAGSTAEFVVDLRGIMSNVSPSYPFSVAAWLNGDQSQQSELEFLAIEQDILQRVTLNGVTNDVQADTNTLTLQNNSGGTKRPIALDSFDLLYWTDLEVDPARGQFAFAHWGDQVAAPGTAVDLLLSIPAGAPPLIWDVSQPDSAFVLDGAAGSGTLTLGLMRDPDTARHFVACQAADLHTVAAGTRVSPRSLFAQGSAVDYLVLHPAPFTFAAQDLVTYRSQHLPGVTAPSARAVDLQDIYNNFSGGQKDLWAIRNFLRHTYQESGLRLRWVCLLGNASRDYRNYRGRTPLVDLYDMMPTVVRRFFPVTPVPLNRRMPFASDDGLVSFESPPSVGDFDFPDLACGRLPALDVQEAQAMVARSIAYADSPEPGLWRNRVLMTADDVFRPSSGQVPLFSENAHTAQSEVITNDQYPASLDVTKLYGIDYSFPPASQVKPAMRADINASINDGATIFYYVGHGAEDNLADEQVFQSRDIPNLGNGMKRPVFVAFSCDVGVYDSPVRRSMAEQFVQYEAGGAIGAICAAQVSWSGDNNRISNAYFTNQFPEQRVDATRSWGESLLLGKALMTTRDYRSNAQRYNLMGDPALCYPHPLDDLVFAPGSLDTLRAGARQTVRLGADGQKLLLGVGDTYALQVAESSFDFEYEISVSGFTDSFVKSGGNVFLGSGTMGAGDLVVPFKVPAQIRYGDRARVRLLLSGPDGDHVAVQTVAAVRGATGAVDDTRGPDIRLAFADNRYRVRVGQEMIASLADTSGIAILGTSPGNSLLLEFDDTGFMTDVTSAFAYDADSYTDGRLNFPLPADLVSGRHRAALHASDALGNVGSDTLSFEIVPAGVVGINAVTLFPNPTSGPCRLLFELSDPMQVQWDVYSVAGSRVRSITRQFAAAGPRILEWDGRDDQGDEIANGTYLYVLRGRGAADDGRDITQTGKLVIMR